MREPPHARILPDGRRLHLQHGPIDLIIDAWGETAEVKRAYEAAAARFATLLDELCTELPALRTPARPADDPLQGVVARRMQAAVAPYARDMFITPMAAVAGADADEVLAAMLTSARLEKAYVNNGGDIALHLSEGAEFSVGLVNRPDQPALFGTVTLRKHDGIGGIATSGWHGRSFSLGIADAVTVLARTAAEADAAATVIANAVDLPDHPSVVRLPANTLAPDSDLGGRLVTRSVGRLSHDDCAAALETGIARARQLVDRGLIAAAALHLQGRTRTVGSLPLTGGACGHVGLVKRSADPAPTRVTADVGSSVALGPTYSEEEV